jgi:hypothetical protein
MRSTSVVALLLVVGLSGAADAQGFGAPCHVNALCPGVTRGGGRIMNCLRAHRAGLSQQCLAAIGRMVLNRRGGGLNGPGSMRGEGPGGPNGGGPNAGGGPYGGGPDEGGGPNQGGGEGQEPE